MHIQDLIDKVGSGDDVSEAVSKYLQEITTSGSIATPPMPMATQPLPMRYRRKDKKFKLGR